MMGLDKSRVSCPHCDTEMTCGPATITGVYQGEYLAVSIDEAYSCPSCDITILHGTKTGEFGRKLREAHSAKMKARGER